MRKYRHREQSRHAGEKDWRLRYPWEQSPPEIREYKLRFWDAGQENGDWTDVASATVSP